MLIVSHDRELLGLVDQIADLSDGRLRMYGGNLAAYEAMREAEQAAASRAVSAAEADVRREKRDLVSSETKQARRDRQGRQVAASGSLPRIVSYARKRAAQETAGRTREVHLERLAAARSRLAEAEEAVRDDDTIRIALPDTAVPAGRTVLSVSGLDGGWHPVRRSRGEGADALAELIVRGPERLALTGPNGAGKTTLLRALAGRDGAARGDGAASLPQSGYLPQRLDVLDDCADGGGERGGRGARRLGERGAGGAGAVPVPRFSRGRLAGTLSGGERFRAVLATLLLAQPPPQLLLLDEPTNNLDMASVAAAVPGAVLL